MRWDVLSEGQKNAGAGQRRNRQGILRQGSVIGEITGLETFLAESCEPYDFSEHFGQVPKNSNS